jgi:hypothetical protein
MTLDDKIKEIQKLDVKKYIQKIEKFSEKTGIRMSVSSDDFVNLQDHFEKDGKIIFRKLDHDIIIDDFFLLYQFEDSEFNIHQTVIHTFKPIPQIMLELEDERVYVDIERSSGKYTKYLGTTMSPHKDWETMWRHFWEDAFYEGVSTYLHFKSVFKHWWKALES